VTAFCVGELRRLPSEIDVPVGDLWRAMAALGVQRQMESAEIERHGGKG